MTLDLETRPDRIETGRTWRDIPPSPPGHSAAIPKPSPTPPPAKDRARLRWTAPAVLAIVALVIGLALGAWSPWQRSGAAEATTPIGSTAPTPDAASLAPQAEPAPSATLPEEIVPPPAPESQLPQSIIPEDFFQFEGFAGLEEFLTENFGDIRGFEEFFPDRTALIEVTHVPDGYEVTGNSIESSLGSSSHAITLTGPDGPVTVQATRSAAVALPAGQPHQIGDSNGVLVEGDETTVAWLAADDLLVAVAGSAGIHLALLDAVAAGIEATP